ncbi:MAG: SixA phosphatase family protein [Chloroflexota bacterium]
MKTLFILRHAKSSSKYPELSDRQRPLNKRGQLQAPLVGQYVRSFDLTPDLILSSPARRARETAIAVANECGYDGEVDFVESFYPGDPEDYIDVLRDLPDAAERVMVVGHNPGLECLLAGFLRYAETLPTAMLAHVELNVHHWWELCDDTRGKLVRLWRPEV